MSNFLQTTEWAEFQKSLGRDVFEYDKEGISAKIVKHNLPFHKSYLYIPHGPEMDFNSMIGGDKNPVRNFVGWLKETAKTEKGIFVKVEPLNDHVAQSLAEVGFKKSKKEIQPGKTVIIDIGGDELEILGRMHPKTRYNIKVAEKHGIKVTGSDDIDAFWKLMRKTVRRDRFSSHPNDYYGKLIEKIHGGVMHTKLFLAEYDNKPVAGAIILFYGDTGYYLHGASDYDFRQYMAPYLLHWEVIKYLKSQSLKFYDLWGINASKWPGVTRFKLGWGGRTVEYPGSFDLPVSGFWYLLYRIYRGLRG